MSSERFRAIKIIDWLSITVYMPCTGTLQRDVSYTDLLSEIQALIDIHSNCDVLIGGDFNVDLDCHSNLSVAVHEFIVHNQMYRCDLLFPTSDRNTYVNEASNTRRLAAQLTILLLHAMIKQLPSIF